MYLDAFQNGEPVEAEGNNHLGAIMVTAAIIADAPNLNSVIDDRPFVRPRKKGKRNA